MNKQNKNGIIAENVQRIIKMKQMVVPSEAAFVRKVLVVSKLICRKGEEHSFIPIRFMGKYEPVRVMKSAINERWRGLTSIP